MKKLLATLTLSALAVATYGQGFVGTVNIGTAASPIGDTVFIVTHSGARIAGTGYLVQLFYAGPGASESELRAAGPAVSPRTGLAAGVLAAGAYTLEGLTAPGGEATLQLRAWSAALGANFDEAFASYNSQAPSDDRLLGRSGLFTLDTGDPNAVPLPETPPSIANAFPGLTLVPVPEPSTYALGLLGLGLVAMFRRRK